jgi:hypothetical protein
MIKQRITSSVTTNDVRLAGLEPEQVLDVDPRVHAGHDREVFRRLDLLFAGMRGVVKRLSVGVPAVVRQELVGAVAGHEVPPFARRTSRPARSCAVARVGPLVYKHDALGPVPSSVNYPSHRTT